MEKTTVDSRIYLVKSLTPWMMDELQSFSRFQKFTLVLLRNPDEFYHNGLKELKEAGVTILIKPYHSSGLVKKIIIAIGFLFGNLKRMFGKYNMVLGLKSLAWFVLLDPKIFNEQSKMHAQFATQAAIVGLLMKQYYSNKPALSFTFHAYDIYFKNAWFSKLVEKSERAFSISDYNIKYVNDHFIRSEKVVLSRLGVFREKITPIPKEEGVFTIGLMSWFVEKKGIRYLIEAMGILEKKGGLQTRVLLAGDGPLNSELRKMVVSHGLEDKILFKGKISNDQKDEFYTSLDAFVLPSISLENDQDGIPVVLMEAIAYGLPIISTNVSGIPEICIDRYNGFLVEERNSNELADSIAALSENKQLMKEFRENTIQVSKEYDIVSNSKNKMISMNWI